MTTMQRIEPLRTLRMIYFSAWIARRWKDSAFKLALAAFGTGRYTRSKSKGSRCNQKNRHTTRPTWCFCRNLLAFSRRLP